MKIKYKIENYYPAENRAFVVYNKDDLPPMGEWVRITDTMTKNEIESAVIAATPFYKWDNKVNSNIGELLGAETEATYIEPEPIPPKIEPSVILSPRNRETYYYSNNSSNTENVIITTEPELIPVDLESQIRTKRNSLLRRSDWTQLPDNTLTEEEKTNWLIYRKKLRDITEQIGFPESVDWPIQPT